MAGSARDIQGKKSSAGSRPIADTCREISASAPASTHVVLEALTFTLAVLLASAAAGQQSASGIVGFLDRADAPPLEAVAADLQTEESWLRRADFGSKEANDYIHLLADADVPTLQYVADKYYLFSVGEGTWGDGWLSKFVVFDLGMRAFELAGQLSDALTGQVNATWRTRSVKRPSGST